MRGINYSQCWEDAELLKKALTITNNDTVLSITSGGDNTLALLLQEPKKVFSVDINPIQNYLAELKLKSPKVLSHEQYLEFLGVCHSIKRANYFEQISKLLSRDSRTWFLENIKVIESGVIHCGKFERYLNSFRKYFLPLIHSRKTVIRFVNQSTLEDQVAFYKNTWNTWRWKFFFSIATNSSLLRKYARQSGASANQSEDNNYLKRLEQLIYHNHLQTNYYLCYALLGEYGKSLPNYLLKKNYKALQGIDTSSSEFRSEDLLTFLNNISDNTLTKFNLSDAFEFLPDGEAKRIWFEIVRTARSGAIVTYWCNQVEHVPPGELNQNMICNSDLEYHLKKQDRLYFYRSFHIYTVSK